MPSDLIILLLILAYFVLAIILSCLCTFLLRNQLKKRSFFIASLFFILILPAVGMLGMVIYSIWLRYLHNFKLNTNFHKRVLRKFSKEKIIVGKTYGEGGTLNALHNQENSIKDKLQALIKVNLHESPLANQINNALLSYDNDEVRLLAYSQLNKQENILFEKIDFLENQLKKDNDNVNLFVLLAEVYWELLYLNISQEEIKKFIFNKVKGYIKKALDLDPEENNILLLAGRLYLMQNDLTKASSYFKQANKSGVSKYKLAPYFAEIAFINRDFKQIKQLFSEAGPLILNTPKIAAAAKFWIRSNDAK